MPCSGPWRELTWGYITHGNPRESPKSHVTVQIPSPATRTKAHVRGGVRTGRAFGVSCKREPSEPKAGQPLPTSQVKGMMRGGVASKPITQRGPD